MENDIKKLEKLLSEKEAEVESIKYQIEYAKRNANTLNLVGKYIKTNYGKYIKVERVSRVRTISDNFDLKGKVVAVSKQTTGTTSYILNNNDFMIYNDKYMTIISESEFNEVLEKAIKAMRD